MYVRIDFDLSAPLAAPAVYNSRARGHHYLYQNVYFFSPSETLNAPFNHFFQRAVIGLDLLPLFFL